MDEFIPVYCTCTCLCHHWRNVANNVVWAGSKVDHARVSIQCRFLIFFCLFTTQLFRKCYFFYLPVFNSVGKKILGYKNIGGALAPTLPPTPHHTTPVDATVLSRNKLLCVYFHLCRRCIILSLRNEILILILSMVIFFSQNDIIVCVCVCVRICVYVYPHILVWRCGC